MDREYRVLDNGTAVLMTRQPALEEGDVLITFTGAPDGATAVFESGKDAIYRLLKDGCCLVPSDKLCGAVRVTLAVLDGTARPRKWVCEELMADRWESGLVMISPNDANLPQRVTELKLENENIRQMGRELQERIVALEERLERLYEGYDLV